MSAQRTLFLASSSASCNSTRSSAHRYYSFTRKSWPGDNSSNNNNNNNNSGSSNNSRIASIGKATSASLIVSDLPVPKTIAAHLDEYVIGQDQAKKALAVGVFNHYLRAASNRMSALEDNGPSPALYEDRGKAKKLGRGKNPEEDDVILSDFVGQTKGSKRWNKIDQAGVEKTDRDKATSSSLLSSTFFSSLRPKAKEADGQTGSHLQPPPTDRLARSASKLIALPTSSQLKRSRSESPSSKHLDKSNILLIGPSGVGKTHLIRTLSTSLAVPFVHIDATPLTSAGYVGEDVESIMTRLLEAADWNVEEAERGIVCIDEVDKLASPISSFSSGTIKTAGRDVGGTGVQQALLRLLEGSVVSVADKRTGSSSSSVAMSARQSGGTRAGESKPWWSPEMQTLNAEHGKAAQALKMSGGAGQQSEALAEGRKKSGSLLGSDGSGTIRIDTSKVLFVLCGAFVGLQDILTARGGTSMEDVEAEDLTTYGLIPEFVGRLPVIVTLNDLTEGDLCRILTEPKNALVSQYRSLFASYKINLHFTKPAIASLAKQAAQSSKTSSGARVLRRLMEKRLLDAMFDGPNPNGGARYALMDKKAAQGQSQVQLFSRGGKSTWLNAIEEDEEKHKPSLPSKKKSTVTSSTKRDPQSHFTPQATRLSYAPVKLQSHVGPRSSSSTSSSSSSSSSLLARIDEATLRRRARARLTRPSRVGNLRILTSEG